MQSTTQCRKQNVNELIASLKEHLVNLRYKPRTLQAYGYVWNKLQSYCDDRKIAAFSAETGVNFLRELHNIRFLRNDGDGSYLLNRSESRAILMLTDFHVYRSVFRRSSDTLKSFSAEYNPLFEGFINHIRQSGVSEHTILQYRSRLFRLESFLNSQGIVHFSQLELYHVNSYIESLAGFSAQGIGYTIGILKKLFDFAKDTGCHSTSFSESLPKVRRINKYRLPLTFTPEEVERILASINKECTIGKRNYAIMIVVAKLGLRISDVRHLRFDSIDWQNKIITLKQQKTGGMLELPLLEDVGWAIIDYLQHGRPESDCEYIFIKHRAPYGELTDSFQSVVVGAVQKAGIHPPIEKSIGMHTFRHSIATTMLNNGATITDISQTLGHIKLESTQAYIGLSVEMLRECALEVSL